MVSDKFNARDEIMRLVPLIVVEGTNITEAFADRHSLHQTDVEALSLLVVADSQRKVLMTGALGEELGITSGATTFVVNRLERAGLIERVRDRNDQRKVFLHLSNAGRSMAEKFYAPVLQLSNAVMNQFTPAELEVVRRFLESTTAAMAVHRESFVQRQ